jgi:hypothetical protein
MKHLTKIFLVFFLLFGVGSNALADSSAVIQKIIGGKGAITRGEYDDFWNGLGVANDEQKASVIAVMKGDFVAMQKYHGEVWGCAEKAWIEQKMPKCQKAKDIIAELRSTRPEGEDQMSLSLEEGMKNLLTAAANRGEYKMSISPTGVGLSLERIRAAKAGIVRVLARFGQVLRMKY